MKSYFKTLRVLLAIVAILQLSVRLAHAAGDIFMGDYRLIVDDEPLAALERSAFGAATFAYSFASEVGGINFQNTRVIAASNNMKLAVTYDATRPDGKRLLVSVDGKVSVAPLYDWQIKPIVAYADSDTTAVVSLFGPGPDKDNFFYIAYHRAFQKSLLGLRLLQADMLLMDPKGLRKLPRYKTGGPILGVGEKDIDDAKSEQAASQLANLIKMKPIGSWVLSDVDIDVKFISKTDLSGVDFDGLPYYYFWHPYLPSEAEVQMAAMAWIKRHPNATEEDVLNAVKKSLGRSIGDENFTSLMKGKYSLFLDANTPVYRTAMQVMRYSALFRQIRDQSPSEWKEFASQADNITVPQFQTPTRVPKIRH
ncbi:hypothetical protein [Bradyrhizobium sp. ORS 375]|uniref:hypothetical protein n=1 Tax=Bradyrhizobium sp. (strain ORS 375) TaxID=566679 RepID=UPI000558AC27|nr:hypothetical protein [Bradyrhizobium sp. ORS 375]